MTSTSRVALVTGSTSGIGEAIARELVTQGHRVVLNSVSSVDAGQALQSELGPEVAHYVQADVATDAQRLVEESVRRFGQLDIVVNNAGTTVRIPHDDLAAASPDLFRRLFDVNVVSAWQVTVAAMPYLQATGNGCVVNMSSLAGIRATGSSIPYAVSKAALNHLTRLLANVSGPSVRVNAVAPGLVDTPWTAEWQDLHEAMNFVAPMARSAVPADIVPVAMALIESTYVTGQVWVVDGGTGLR